MVLDPEAEGEEATGEADMTYYVRPYDGEGGDSLETINTEWGPFDSLDEAREFVSDELLGVDYGSFKGAFSEAEEAEGLIECWHSSDEEGCGGYAIYDVSED